MTSKRLFNPLAVVNSILVENTDLLNSIKKLMQKTQRSHFKEKTLEDLELILNGVKNLVILIHANMIVEDISIIIVDLAVIEGHQDLAALKEDIEIDGVIVAEVSQALGLAPIVVAAVIDVIIEDIEKDHLVQEVNTIIYVIKQFLGKSRDRR